MDTKKDVQELAGNVGHDHDRFVRELDRATLDGKTLVILVEEHPEYEGSPQLIGGWVSRVCRRCGRCDPTRDACRAKRRKPMNGPQLAKILRALEERHGVRFMFCDRSETAERVCEILGVNFER